MPAIWTDGRTPLILSITREFGGKHLRIKQFTCNAFESFRVDAKQGFCATSMCFRCEHDTTPLPASYAISQQPSVEIKNASKKTDKKINLKTIFKPSIILINHHCYGFLQNIYTTNIFNDILIVACEFWRFIFYDRSDFFSLLANNSQLFIIEAAAFPYFVIFFFLVHCAN